MLFKTVKKGMKFVAVLLFLYLILAAFVLIKLSFGSLEHTILLGALFLIGAVFVLMLIVGSRYPDMRLEMDGIYLDKIWLGNKISTYKVVDFKALRIKLKPEEIKLYSQKKFLFLYRKHYLTVVGDRHGSFLKKRSWPCISEFYKFAFEVFRRAKSVQIDKTSFEVAQNAGIELGVNVTVLGDKTEHGQSVAGKFIKDFFDSKKD